MKSPAPCLVLAVGSLILAAVGGCGRRGLSKVDAGDSGTNQDPDGATVPDVPSAGEADASSAGQTDLPTQPGPDVGAETLPCTPAPQEPTSLGLLGGDLFGSGIALLGDRLFVGVEDRVSLDGQIVGVSLSTGATITPDVDPTLHAMDDTHIYWVNNGEVALYRAPKNGGAVETVWDVPNRWVVDLAVDACNIYWTVLNPPELYARAR